MQILTRFQMPHYIAVRTNSGYLTYVEIDKIFNIIIKQIKICWRANCCIHHFQGRFSSTNPDSSQLGFTSPCTRSNHPYSHPIPLVSRKIYPDNFFLRITTLWNRLPRCCLSEIYNLILFKSRVKSYLSDKSS